MMRAKRFLFCRQARCQNPQALINLHGIGIDDVAVDVRKASASADLPLAVGPYRQAAMGRLRAS